MVVACVAVGWLLLLTAPQHVAAQPAQDGAGGQMPDPGSDRPVTLDGILAWADEHAPAVATAESRVALGDAARTGARPLFHDNPVVSVRAGMKQEGGQSGYKLETSLLQPIEIFGERRQRIQAADATHERLEVERDATRWRVHQRVHRAYHRALLARERAEVADRVLEFQQELLRYAEKRLEAGDIGQLPVRLTQGETADARQRKIAADQQYQSARIRLAEVAGWPIETPPEPAGELDEAREAPPLERLVRLAQQNHPTLRTQQARIDEAEAQADLADRKGWPDPAIGVAYGREEVGNNTEQAVLGLLQIPFPIWRQNTTERARADAQLEIAQAEQDQVRFNLRARLARAASEVDAAAERVEVYGQQVLPELESNLEMLRRGFELGEFSILDVSVARERFLRIQLQAFDAYAAYFDAVAELEAQVGTELWPDTAHDP